MVIEPNLDINLTKPLAYIGTSTTIGQTETDKYCQLQNDMDGIKSYFYGEKTRFYLRYGNSVRGDNIGRVTYYFHVIAAGKLTFYRRKNSSSNQYRAITDGTIFTIEHTEGIKTHYSINTINESALQFSDGRPLNENMIGTEIAEGDYIMFISPSSLGGEFGYLSNVCIAIEQKGRFLNPRNLTTDPTIFPTLAHPNGGFTYLTNYEDLWVGYKNPLSFMNVEKITGNPSNPFAYENSQIVIPSGDYDVYLMQDFFYSVTETTRNNMKFKPDYNRISIITSDGVNYHCVNDFLWIINGIVWNRCHTERSIVIGTDAQPPVQKTYTIEDVSKGNVRVGYWFGKVGAVITTYTMVYSTSSQSDEPTQMFANMLNPRLPIFTADTEFIPDDGVKPDKGGGDKDWGQGNSKPNTSGGNFNNNSDVISSGDSSGSKVGHYYNNYYILDTSQVFTVKNKIWSVSVPGVTKPSEAIISLAAFPLDLSHISFDINSLKVQIGNTAFDLKTNPWMLKANYDNSVDFGTIKIEPYFGGFQDYSPYTKIQIYLPFIGMKDLDPDYVQGKTLRVKYYINYTNGTCIATIWSEGKLYLKFNGQVGQSVPLSQVDSSLVEATINTAMNVGTTLLTKGLASGGTTKDIISSSLSHVAANKPNISGSIGGGGEAELSLPLECFLIIERPRCAVPQTYNSENGRPSMVNKKLSNCKGYTKMLNPQVQATCTSEENDMINNLLKEGVIIL